MEHDQNQLLPPGEYLRKILDERGMGQNDLAFILGVQQQAINQLVQGKRGISADMAKSLGTVFGIEPEYLLRLQKAAEMRAELARARTPDPALARKAQLIAAYPIREMIKRGWLFPDQTSIEAEMARFFGVSSMDDVPHVAHAAKKSRYDEIPAAQLAWIFRVKEIAARLVVPPYSEKALRLALPKLRALLRSPEEVSRAPRLVAECGVRLVFVESLPGAKIDGVCLWLDGGKAPVVGMSLRFDRIDNFWFVLRHELEHVLLRHGVNTWMRDVDLQCEDASGEAAMPEEERLANAAAADFCVPTAKMESWIARKAPFFGEQDLLGFAKVQQIHPGLAAGQVRSRTKKYHLFTRFLVKVRSHVTATGVVDGWGEQYPTR